MGMIIDNVNWATRTFEPFRQGAEILQRQPAAYETTAPKPLKKENKKPVIVEVLPGQELPEGYADYRPFLQRDGLILYAWADNEKDLETICPKEKYKTVRFLNEKPIANKADFIIYAAPSGFSANMKTAFIAKLKEAGLTVNFDYEFSLGRQKAEQECAVFDKIENRQTERAWNSEEAEFLKLYQKLDSAGKTEIGEYMRTLLLNQGEA